MKMTQKRTSLALASAGLLALAVPGLSHATSLATSILQLSNFLISDQDGVLDVTDFSSLTFNSTADTSANLDGVEESAKGTSANATPIDIRTSQPGIIVYNPGNTSVASDMCVGDCPAMANNAFTAVTNPPTSTYAAADQNEAGTPIAGLPVTLGATVEAGSWVSLADAGDGSATSNNGLDASFSFILVGDPLGGSRTITFSFDALAYMEAFVSADALNPTNAQASYKAIFKITDAAGIDVFNWEPDGVDCDTAGDGGTSVCKFTDLGVALETDPFDLNDSASRNDGSPGTTLNPDGTVAGVKTGGAFSATTLSGLLTNGVLYTLTLSLETRADAKNTVPEPASLALLGMGLVGLGLSRRRRKTA